MNAPQKRMTTLVRKSHGFALIEALVAFMILSVGLLGIVKLQSLVLTTGADTKAKAQAIAIVESRIDALRNRVLKSTSETDTSNAAIANTSFDALLANGSATETVTPAGGIHTFTVQTTISSATGTTDGKLIQVVVTWDDLLTNKLNATTGSTQSVAGRTIVSWDDPSLGRAVSTGTVGGGASSAPALKTPTGVAERGDGSVDATCAGCNATNDGFGTRTRTLASGATELRSSTGALLLTLPASTTTTQTQFATISGKVYVDKGLGNGFSQSSGDLTVRLSSEGICLYNNTSATNVYNSSSTFNSSTLLYEYFSYICYVGEGWYGNVGIWNISNQTPKICVGDSAFNGGNSDGTLISPHAVESSTRSYRGFIAKTGGGYLSSGILGGSTYPQSGRPQPSSYYSTYGISSGASNNYFNHDFLVTKSNQSCVSRMSAYTVNTGKFVRNAGQYFCINPDNDTVSADQCPSTWPGFESQVAGSGGTNYMLTVSMSGSGSVASNPTAITCTTGSCSGSFASGTTVSLTATPDTGYVFSGWTGACTGTGTCTVSMSSDQSVTAEFTQATTGTYQLGVTVNGTGTVTSAPSGISCSSGTCLASFSANASVVLTATPSGSSTFTGWGGACSGASSTCTVTMSSAQNVTATFTTAAPSTYTLSLAKSGAGSGTVTSVPSGISCGTACTSTSYAFTTGTSVTLTASASSGSTFGGWGGACSGTSSTCTLTMSAAQAVTATFYSTAACATTFSGSVTTMPSNATNVDFIVTPSGGSCTKTKSTSNYNCSFSTTGGAALSIRVQWKEPSSGSTVYSSGTLSQTADCLTHTNVNIP